MNKMTVQATQTQAERDNTDSYKVGLFDVIGNQVKDYVPIAMSYDPATEKVTGLLSPSFYTGNFANGAYKLGLLGVNSGGDGITFYSDTITVVWLPVLSNVIAL